MEYYTLSRLSYLKYYFLILYYQMADLAPVVRACAIITTICVLLVIILLIRSFVKAEKETADARHVERNRKRWHDVIKEIALTERTMDLAEITEMLHLPKNFKMKEKPSRLMVPVLLDLYQEVQETMNRTNWQRMLMAFKMHVYFEEQVRSRNIHKRIVAFKNVADMDAPLKEAVASRYLFAKSYKLKICARLHAARFGTSYPFKVLEEDPNLVFTEELMVKYHNVLVFRANNNMTMPNFIRWCNRVPINEDLRVFAVNEIRLFGKREDCAELLSMLETSKDERFSCALIRALGELDYIPAEKEFCRRYLSASFTERQVLAEALGAINSGSPEILAFLVEDYRQSTDYVSRMKLLRVIHDYGRRGAEAFNMLKAEADPERAILFKHIECDLIDSRKYA